MATILADSTGASTVARPSAAPGDHVAPVLYAVLFSAACIVFGLIWDISWHMTIGRDTLWSPPHVLEQIGASVAGLACGAYVLWMTFRAPPSVRAQGVRFWGFRGPLGAWVCIWGALTMIASVPFDDWWHNAYGLDVQILSPPHTVLLAGMVAIQIGAMLFALALQNRGSGSIARRAGWMYAFAAGVLVTMGAVAWAEHIAWPNTWHSARTYRIAAGVFPLFLVAAARAGRLRWPATAAAATYMAIMLLMLWILPRFEAQAMLAPIMRPVDAMVPMPFPILLIAPALAIDLLMHRFGAGRDWLLAALIALAFVGVLLAVQWPFSSFMLSPAARNPFFGGDISWGYTNAPGAYQYRFWSTDPDSGAFAAGIGRALLFGFVSARVGLVWGGWMKRVLR